MAQLKLKGLPILLFVLIATVSSLPLNTNSDANNSNDNGSVSVALDELESGARKLQDYSFAGEESNDAQIDKREVSISELFPGELVADILKEENPAADVYLTQDNNLEGERTLLRQRRAPQGAYGYGGYSYGGYGQGGYGQGGYSQGGYSRGGYSQGGHSQGGHGQGASYGSMYGLDEYGQLAYGRPPPRGSGKKRDCNDPHNESALAFMCAYIKSLNQ